MCNTEEGRKRKEKKDFCKRSNRESTSIPFCYDLFRKAYILLKVRDRIKQTEILEQKKKVSFDIYQTVYWNALRTVFMECKRNITDREMEDLLVQMFEEEYDAMVERMTA